MPATAVSIAAAIVSALEAGSYSETVRVERAYVPDMDLTELQEDTEPQLTVIPSRHIQAPYSRDRDTWADSIVVDVGIRARCLTLARADELALLTEEVLDHVRTTIDTNETLPLQQARTDPYYDPETLSTHQVWFGVLRFSFGLTKAEAA